MTEKNGTSYRNAVIGVGVLCGVLLIALAYLISTISTYTSMMEEKDAIITSQSGSISNLQSQIIHKDSQISSLNKQVSDLQTQLQNQDSGSSSQINYLNSIINLQMSEVWLDHETIYQNTTVYGILDSVNYAGFIEVEVESSDYTNIYVEVNWVHNSVHDSQGILFEYNNKIPAYSSLSKFHFPVLPTEQILVEVGHTNLQDAAYETVTVTYYY